MWPFHFQVTHTEVQVRLGPFVVRRVLLDDIESVRVLSGGRGFLTRDWLFWNEHWTNFWPLRYVVLRRRMKLSSARLAPGESARYDTEWTRVTPDRRAESGDESSAALVGASASWSRFPIGGTRVLLRLLFLPVSR